MANWIVTGILFVIVGLAVFVIVKAKKNGARCIGCPDSVHCGRSGSECGCHASRQ